MEKIINFIIDFLIEIFKIIFGINNNEVKNEIEKYRYKINKIMTYREIGFFKRLKEYLKEEKEVNIFTKIRLADIISAEKNIEYIEKQKLFNKISRKHIDFIICDDFGNIKCLIELDDNTHKYNSNTIKNDEFKNKVFKQLGLPLIRFKIGETWNFDIIKENWI